MAGIRKRNGGLKPVAGFLNVRRTKSFSGEASPSFQLNYFRPEALYVSMIRGSIIPPERALLSLSFCLSAVRASRAERER